MFFPLSHLFTFSTGQSNERGPGQLTLRFFNVWRKVLAKDNWKILAKLHYSLDHLVKLIEAFQMIPSHWLKISVSTYKVGWS